jgi:rod shape-determining protein MreC
MVRGGNRRRFVLALVVLTSLTLITLDTRGGRSGPLGSVGRIAHTIVSPVERATSAVARPIGDWWSGVFDSGSLERRNRALQARIAELEGERHAAEVALAQNADLKRLLGLGFLSGARPVAARIVDRDPGNFESTFTIDRGQESGIQKDMAVVAPDGVVGHVIDAWHGGAKVRVLTDPDSAVAVRTTKLPATGIAQGQQGSRELVVADFDAGAKVRAGEQVVTADLSNSVFPPDLPVGRVTSVDVQPAGLGLVVRIAPYVNFDALEFVEVLRWVPGGGSVVPPTTSTTTPPTGVNGGSTSTSSPSSTSTTGAAH